MTLFTKTDFEMLPDWVSKGKHAAEFLEWLLCDDCKTFEKNSEVFIKCVQGEFRYIYYYMKYPSGYFLEMDQKLMFAGLFHVKDYALYDVSPYLSKAIGFSKEIRFADKKSVKEKVGKEINAYIFGYLEKNWDGILQDKKYEIDKMIPKINPKEISEMAQWYYLEKKETELQYIPHFSFGSIENEFSDDFYLLYLMAPKKVIQSFSMRWIKNNVKNIFRQKVILGCVEEELREIYAAPKHRLHNIRRLICSLDKKYQMVRVQIKKKGISMELKIPTENLRQKDGQYSMYRASVLDREKFEETFGRHEYLYIEDIVKVLHGKQILFEA